MTKRADHAIIKVQQGKGKVNTMNTIYTDAEYKKQGFRDWEVPMIRRHDELYYKWEEGMITEEEKEEMLTLAAQLEL